jgi:multidrug efflux system membrane fusion protein
MKKIVGSFAFVFCVGAVLLLSGRHATGQMPGGPSGPMPVSVMTLAGEQIQQWHEFSGTLVAVERVEIRPRVGGSIDKIYFTPGVTVEKGAKLFLIDPRPYQADVNRAAADLAVAKTEADLARSEAERVTRLIVENAIARRAYDERDRHQRSFRDGDRVL